MKPVIYIRGSFAEREEIEAAKEWFFVAENRAAIPEHSLVIPRYTALPYYMELEADMADMRCRLINTYQEHNYVAHMRNWYYDLADITPRTWFALDQMPIEGPFVMKGATNSKKFQWDTHMFAKDRYEAVEVACRLGEDSVIGTQPIVGREYVELTHLADGVRGLKVCEEYRFFVLNGVIVDAGFYWSSHQDDLDREYSPWDEVPEEFTYEVIKRVSPHIPFFVFDVARKADGDWMVVELNDGQQSGLSAINPNKFYENLRYEVDRMLE